MNGILLLDKPAGFTSHDCVAKLRSILRERRIGHAGTLDPMATGLLVVFIGRATRAVSFAESNDKEYTAGLRLGLVTDTEDITGRVLSTNSAKVSEDTLIAALHKFLGEISQIPPMYSAIKIGGKKLYEIARRGEEIERTPRAIRIDDISLLSFDGIEAVLHISCSKGTYIRTICHDIGAQLGVGACMSSLRRTRAGVFDIKDALRLADVESAVKDGCGEDLLIPVDKLFDEFPELTIDQFLEKRCRCGNSFPFDASDGNYRVYSTGGGFLMLGSAKNGIMSTVKSFFEV